MVLARPVYSPDNQQILLSYGTKLKDSSIQKLISVGVKEVDIADQYTIFVDPVVQMEKILKENYFKEITRYSSENPEGNLCDEMVTIARMVKSTVNTICKKEEILNFCVQMKIQKDNRLFSYAILTSVFSGLVAGALGLFDDMYNIMVGGLLHNIGCLEMPFLIGVKNLKGQEELLWKEHPVYGYYFTIQNNIPRPIAEIILHHHENWDGSGYPKKLKEEEIPLGARIVSVCSTVSSFMYFDNVQPYEAMEYLYCSSNIFFDKKIVDAFVNNITLYPLGSLVRLTSGEVGIVSNVRQNKGPRPIVNVYYNRFNKPLSEPHIIDMGKERTIFISEVLE
jgi:HD-GYP domain-containing protein (c-di-GMP phosphodiesterase class II)